MKAKPCFLVVEDDDNYAALLERSHQLHADTCQLKVVSSAESALDYLKESYSPIDLIIVDFDLPGMNGFSFIDCIRSFPSRKHLPIIMVSSYSHTTFIDTAYSHGVNAYIIKPNSYEKLVQLWKVIIDFWLLRASLYPIRLR